jgi:hypothetical protein
MTDREELEKRLDRINTLIEEAESRLGAHSVKAVLMQELFALEEERDEIMNKLKRLIEIP